MKRTMTRRGKFDIISDILVEAAPKGKHDEVRSGATKTSIMINSGITYPMLKSCLGGLEKKDMLAEENGIYTTTEIGLQFLEIYHEIDELLK